MFLDLDDLRLLRHNSNNNSEVLKLRDTVGGSNIASLGRKRQKIGGGPPSRVDHDSRIAPEVIFQ